MLSLLISLRFQLRELLLNHVVESNLPFMTVRSSSLKLLLEEVGCRDLSMPSIDTIMALMSKRFDEMEVVLKELLSKQRYLCLTADVWTCRSRSYLGISVHFIDSEWIRKSFILAFKHLNKRHTYDYLAKCINEVIDKYGINGKVRHVVTDGGSNFCKAFRKFGQNDDFSQTLARIQEDAEEDEIDEQDDILMVQGETYLILEDGDNNSTNEILTQMEIVNEIQSENIQSDQIEFPEEIELESEIVLPPQMRCFAHLLNLIGIFRRLCFFLISIKAN